MKILASFFCLLFTYIILSAVMFGNPFAPLMWKYSSYDTLGFDNYAMLGLGALISFLYLKVVTRKEAFNWVIGPSIFLLLFMLSVFAMHMIYFSFRIHHAAKTFEPDELRPISFHQSLLHLDDFFRYRHHAELVKDCKIYIWSYGSRAFEEVNYEALEWAERERAKCQAGG